MANQTPFRNRGREVTRLEAFSDVVFGFALTLIVVSLEVPKTFDELNEVMRGFFGFAICFAILVWVWHAHHTFFRRYSLTDEYTIFLNTMLLFLVLFYTYPMKFMFAVLTRNPRALFGRASELFVIYGLGFAGIFAVMLLMYRHAWHKRDELELNEVERFDTRTLMIMYGSYVAIGLASTLLAVTMTSGWVSLAGWIYWLIGPVSAFIGFRRGAMRARLAGASLSASQPLGLSEESAQVPPVV